MTRTCEADEVPCPTCGEPVTLGGAVVPFHYVPGCSGSDCGHDCSLSLEPWPADLAARAPGAS